MNAQSTIDRHPSTAVRFERRLGFSRAISVSIVDTSTDSSGRANQHVWPDRDLHPDEALQGLRGIELETETFM
jgi:hypothetical protein